MQQLPDDHIRLALTHVSSAIQGIERSVHEAYADAAYDARISAYGNICAKRALLQRIRADLTLLQRSISAPGVLASEQP